MRPVACAPLTEDAFRPFGTLIAPPGAVGERRRFDALLHPAPSEPGLAPVFHTNLVAPVTLPHEIAALERHPHAAQGFVPLDAGRFLVVVAPSTASGEPDLSAVRSFVAPGGVGVVYGRGVWHAGARALDRAASFAVLMWRGLPDDDVFLSVPPIRIEPEPAFA
ncbi:ureidoglycolate lyase [Aureimonas sp. AU4]|uniref:ureidoglycolate lyase n=1 Tax=Aureimonas sp. AU4 TaxID=1638163 RepID=UPI000785E7EA|nr:ureidoglycolate lyase [Aureimonas sp. AU4]